MFVLLRVVRGICGFVFALQAIHVVEAVAWLLKQGGPSPGVGSVLAVVTIKIIVIVIAGLLFFWLRRIINRLHVKKREPHPVLAEKKWAL